MIEQAQIMCAACDEPIAAIFQAAAYVTDDRPVYLHPSCDQPEFFADL